MVSKTLLIFFVVFFLSDFSYGQRDKKYFRNDYSYLEAVEGFYKIHTTKKTWAEAKQVCAQEGASFFHPKDDNEAQVVISFLNSTQPQIGVIYLGLSDILIEGAFETIDGKAAAEVYHNWQPHQPDNYMNNQDCAYLFKSSGQMDDGSCDSKNHFICSKSLKSLDRNNQCNMPVLDGQRDQKYFRNDYSYLEAVEGFYKIHTTQKTWAEAKQVCAQEGATFFHPKDDNEAQVVISFWNSTQPQIGAIYLGLSDIYIEGAFETIDGTAAAEVYHNWQPHQPDNYMNNQDCAYLFKSSGQMDDGSCDAKNYFICGKSRKSLERNCQCNMPALDGQRDKKKFRVDYSYLEAVEGFYKFHTTPKTWAEAKQVCAQEGASFFHPRNENEAQAVISFWNSIQPQIDGIFLGLSDILVEGVFETIDGKAAAEVYHNWQPHQPDNYMNNQDCAYLFKSSGQMDDGSCDSKNHFICSKSLKSLDRNNQCNMPVLAGGRDQRFFRYDYKYLEAVEGFYKIHTTPKSWAEAKQVCALEGASFFHPENDNEAQAVISFWNSTKPQIGAITLGLSDILVEGLFETIDGRAAAEVYHNWQPHQPDNYMNNQDCAYLFKSSGQMDDGSCDSKNHFICSKSLKSLEWNYQCNMPALDYTFNEENGKCYKLHTTPLNWMDAHVVCRTEQSYLAVINNPMEADHLASLAESASKQRVGGNYISGIFHLGLHNKLYQGWQTVRGKPFNYSDAWWGKYQPDTKEVGRCGSMFYTGRLTHTDCVTKSFFICEHEVGSSNCTIAINEDLVV